MGADALQWIRAARRHRPPQCGELETAAKLLLPPGDLHFQTDKKSSFLQQRSGQRQRDPVNSQAMEVVLRGDRDVVDSEPLISGGGPPAQVRPPLPVMAPVSNR